MAVHPLLRRATAVGVLAVVAVAWAPTAASACACGALVSDSPLQAFDETALVTLEGDLETVTVDIATRRDPTASYPEEPTGDTASTSTVPAPTNLAFVMPVPAQADFSLADADLFTDLDTISRPEVKTVQITDDPEILGLDGSGDGTSGGAPAAGANVLDEITLGPYDVVQLNGAADEVATWLTTNGFTASEGLLAGLGTYLAEGWNIVAAKLSATSDPFGALPPMQVRFTTDAPVYPMRLSVNARSPQQLRLYVLADHRTDTTTPTPGAADPDLVFAGWVDPTASGAATLATEVSSRSFLTRYDLSYDPASISADMTLTRAATDATYRTVITQYEHVRSGWTIPLTVGVWGGLPLLVVGLAVLLVVRRRRRPVS